MRVPNFGEFYKPVDTGLLDLNDLCEAHNIYRSVTLKANFRALDIATPGLASQLPSNLTRGGNPDLQPESASSLTFDAILQPHLIPGLNMADMNLAGQHR